MKKKIIILGYSVKFRELLLKIFSKYEFHVIKWRNLEYKLNYRKIKNIYLVIVCGYDYSCNLKNLKIFLKKNIIYPYKFLMNFKNLQTRIVYINTENSKNKVTLSRYEYAKKRLAYKINKNIKNSKIIHFPVILNNNNFPDLKASFCSKLIIKILIFFKLTKAINFQDLEKRLKKEIFDKKNQNKIKKIKPFFIGFPRTILIDRVLRLISKR